MLNDVRYAVRSLTRTPGVVLVIVLCLALGLGANTTIFALTNAIFLRPLPVSAPDRLVRIYSGWGGARFRSSSYPEYQALNARRDAFSAVAAYSRARVSVGQGEETTIERAIMTSGNFFEVVGLTPAAGRFFTTEEDRVAGEHNVAVLSHAFWVKRFGGSMDVLNRSFQVNGKPFRIVGVAPAEFFGLEPENEAAIWVPIMTYPTVLGGDDSVLRQNSRWLALVGRLADGVNFGQARVVAGSVARANVFGASGEMASTFEFTVLRGGTLANTEVSAEIKAVFVVLNAVVVLVLLIACANVANVLLARALDRRREIAIRLSLGSGRLRLIRQLLTEALLLGLLGGGAGLVLAWWGAGALQAFRLPAGVVPTIDRRVFFYSFAIALCTALLFGLVPALESARAGVTDALKQGRRLGGTGRSRLRSGLVVGQLSLSVLLLVVAGLLLRALQELRAANSGVVEERMIAAELDLTTLGVGSEQGQLLFDRVLERVRNMPDVEAASFSAMVPSAGRQWVTGGVTLPGHAQYDREAIGVSYNVVEPDYFSTLGIPLLRGRTLQRSDRSGGPLAIVVNDAFARRYWPGQNAVGSMVRLSEDRMGEVVGVVADVRYESAGVPALPTMFFTYYQEYQPNLTLQVRARSGETQLLGQLRRALQDVRPGLAAEYRTFTEIRREGEFAPRTVATLLGVFGAVALLLATIGLYGVIAYLVTQRTHEIGIRMALGARPLRVLQLIAQQGFRHVFIGLAIGGTFALAAGKLVSSALFGVRAFDLAVLAIVSALMMTVALVATMFPAQRAASVDPAIALRAD
jgi:predicted permease